MARLAQDTPLQKQFGKALADRMGLNHNSTLDGWEAESSGEGVMVRMVSIRYFTHAEYAELALVASNRALEGSEVAA